MPKPCPAPAVLALALVLGVALTAPALAQYEAATPAACLAIDVDAERLQCFDTVHQRTRPAPTPTRPISEIFRSEPDQSIARSRVEQSLQQPATSLLDARWELSPEAKLGAFNLRSHRPVYLLPGFWSSDPNDRPTSPNPDNIVTAGPDLNAVEAKFQLSFKTKAWQDIFGNNGDLWLGYTQSSRWQVYNADASRPFRETNYEPEAMLVFRTGYRVLGWDGRLAGIGVLHQSNGRSLPESRSWDRVVAQLGFERDNWVVMLRPWWRISESSDSDDNGDIEDYMGRGDLLLTHVRGEQQFSLMARHSLRGGEDSRGALRLDWSFPLNRGLRGHVQAFSGYGESMIDYNHRATYLGLGVSLIDWY